MLYKVADPSNIKVLTHGFTPYHEKNGFNQVPKNPKRKRRYSENDGLGAIDPSQLVRSQPTTQVGTDIGTGNPIWSHPNDATTVPKLPNLLPDTYRSQPIVTVGTEVSTGKPVLAHPSDVTRIIVANPGALKDVPQVYLDAAKPYLDFYNPTVSTVTPQINPGVGEKSSIPGSGVVDSLSTGRGSILFNVSAEGVSDGYMAHPQAGFSDNGYTPGSVTDPHTGRIVGRKRKRYGEDDESENELSGFSLKKAVKKVTSNVKQLIRKPIPTLVKVAARIPTGGITLITETGVLGKDAKKVGKKVDVVSAGAIGGAAAGFIVNPTPVGIIVGATAGTVKGIDEATKTSKPGDSYKAFYQGAAWGGGSAAVARATTAGFDAYNKAQVAKDAKVYNETMFAAKSGYGASSVPTSTLAKVGGTVWDGSKWVAKNVFGPAAGMQAIQALAGPRPPGTESGGQSIDGGPGEGININIGVPGSDGTTPVGYGYTAGGGEFSSGDSGLPEISASPNAGSGLLDEIKKTTGLSTPMLASVGLLAFVVIKNRKFKRAA